MRPFPSGCWTCKLRHRKCDSKTPACRECLDRQIPCHGYGPKPLWMDGAVAETRELTRIKKAVKQHVRNLRKSQNRDRQAERDRHSAARTNPPQVPSENLATPPTRAVVVLSPPSPSEQAPEDAFHELGEGCSGDLVSPSSGHSHDPVQDERSTSTGPQSTFACVFRPESASLVMHYLDHVFYWQYPYFQPRSRLGNRGWLLAYLSNGGPLYHAALALSALHRNKVQISRRQDYLRNQEAFEYHSKALRELFELSQRTETEALLNDKSQLAEFAASSLMLISFEVRHRLTVEVGVSE